ncbi:MAG: hypothetical protein K2W95_07130 [Candidatus Obscuribacterales bacterium]|nr:hypothetical protein [Candidatus Obscuribacterales bacterium]
MFGALELTLVGLVAVVGLTRTYSDNRARRQWNLLEFKQPPSIKDLTYVGIDSASRLIKGACCKKQEWIDPSSPTYLTILKGARIKDNASPNEQKFKITVDEGQWIHYGKNSHWKRVARHDVYLHWTLLQTAENELQVSVQWSAVGRGSDEDKSERAFGRVINATFMELGALSQANKSFFAQPNVQSTPPLIGSPVQQTNLNDFSATPGWHHGNHINLPERFYEQAKLGIARDSITNTLTAGGTLADPFTTTLELVWSGECPIELSEDGQAFLAKLSFSDYVSADSDTFNLSNELLMRFLLKPDEKGLTVNCAWQGQLNSVSGDMVRHILALMDEAILVSTGNAPMNPRRGQVSRTASTRKRRQPPPQIEKRVSWPTMQDVNEAMQCTSVCFLDPELQRGKPELTPLGFPRVATGAFASVYKIVCAEQTYAVRFFNSPIKDQEDRYHKTSKFICSDDLPYTVPLDYLEHGITLGGRQYPVLKMEWVEGASLDSYIEQNLNRADKLIALRKKFQQMMDALRRSGIAHSDLQHGNILVRNEEFVLVDYDGMFVPDLSGYLSNELGHPNYQHPARTSRHFGPNIDNFSAWLIDTCLLCLTREPELWRRFSTGGENLLFKRSDLEAPESSTLFALLNQHPSAEVRSRIEYLQTLLRADIDEIPFLTEDQGPLRKRSSSRH